MASCAIAKAVNMPRGPGVRLQTGTEFGRKCSETAGGSDSCRTTGPEEFRSSPVAQVCNAPVIDQPRNTRFDYALYVVEHHQPVRIWRRCGAYPHIRRLRNRSTMPEGKNL